MRTANHGVLFVGICLALCWASVVPTAAEISAEARACEAARAEILARYPVPATFAELLTIPLQERNLVLSQASPELRSSLWREHYRRVLEQQAVPLDRQQVALIQEASALSSPEVFATTEGDPGYPEKEARLARLNAQRAKLFPQELSSAIFTKISGQAKADRGDREDDNGPMRIPNCTCLPGDCNGCVVGGLCVPQSMCGPSGLQQCAGRGC